MEKFPIILCIQGLCSLSDFAKYTFSYNSVFRSFDSAEKLVSQKMSSLVRQNTENMDSAAMIELKVYMATLSYYPAYFQLLIANKNYVKVCDSVIRSIRDIESNIHTDTAWYYSVEDEDEDEIWE